MNWSLLVMIQYSCVKWRSWAKFGYHKQRRSVLAVWRRWGKELMVPDAWSPAEQGMKYLPFPFRWEGRTLIKVSCLHPHPSAASSLHYALKLFKELSPSGTGSWGNLYNMSVEFSLDENGWGRNEHFWHMWESSFLLMRETPVAPGRLHMQWLLEWLNFPILVAPSRRVLVQHGQVVVHLAASALVSECTAAGGRILNALITFVFEGHISHTGKRHSVRVCPFKNGNSLMAHAQCDLQLVVHCCGNLF